MFSWPAICIHGDKAQAERDWALNGKHNVTLYITQFVLCVHLEFRQGQSPILLATDVASRGLGKVIVQGIMCSDKVWWLRLYKVNSLFLVHSSFKNDQGDRWGYYF